MVEEPDIITREKKMVETMVKIYCKDHHDTKKALCSECVEIKDYAKNRLENCRYQEKKPVCGKCGLKCYNNEFKDKTKKCSCTLDQECFSSTQLLEYNTFVIPSKTTTN